MRSLVRVQQFGQPGLAQLVERVRYRHRLFPHFSSGPTGEGELASEHRKQYMKDWWASSPERRSRYNNEFLQRRKRAFEDGTIKRVSEKRCSICKTVKSADKFYLSNTNKNGLHGWCKPCSDQRTVENGRKRLHGLTPAEYQEMYVRQDGRCAICSVTEPRAGRKSFCVDHDHGTGKVRGLLCTRCNTMIGNARDDVAILRAAIAFLEGSK
jgi:hypothetical protein